MKLLLNEMYKLSHSKVFLFVFVLAALLNIYISFTSEISGNKFSDESYKNLYVETYEMDYDEAKSFLQNKIDSLLLSDTYTSNPMEERALLIGQLEQLNSIYEYKNYLENIKSSAESMTSVSIFSDINSFSYRNIVLTSTAYKSVKNVTPIFESSYGVLLASENIPCNLLILFVVLTSVIVLFQKEKESGLLALFRATKNGRCRFATSKIIVVFLLCLFTTILFSTSRLLIGYIRFGIGDLLHPLQSIEGYIGCNLPINVLQFLIFTYLIKIFAIFFSVSIFTILTIKLSNVWAYSIFIVLFGIEVSFFLCISENSVLSPLKQLNSVAFIDSSRLFKTYSNINFFGYPINLLCSSLVFLFVGILATVFFSIYLFSSINPSYVRRNNSGVLSHFLPKKAITYAFYKAMIIHKGALIILVLLVVQIYNALSYEVPYNIDDNYYKSYCNIISEMSQDDADTFLENEAAKFETIKKELLNSSGLNTAANELRNELNAENGYVMAKAQFEHIIDLRNDGENNAKMFYQSGYKELFGVTNNKTDVTLNLLTILAMCFCISPLVSYDKRFKMDTLISSSKLGKRYYLLHQIIVCTAISVLVSLAVNLPYITGVLSAYGTDGIFCSLKCIADFSSFTGILIANYIILLISLRAVFCIFLSIIIMWISAKSNSPASAMIISLALTALPTAAYLIGANFMIYISVPLSINYEVTNQYFITAIAYTIICIACFIQITAKYSDLKPHFERH